MFGSKFQFFSYNSSLLLVSPWNVNYTHIFHFPNGEKEYPIALSFIEFALLLTTLHCDSGLPLFCLVWHQPVLVNEVDHSPNRIQCNCYVFHLRLVCENSIHFKQSIQNYQLPKTFV